MARFWRGAGLGGMVVGGDRRPMYPQGPHGLVSTPPKFLDLTAPGAEQKAGAVPPNPQLTAYLEAYDITCST